jgi:hypothetical protein
MKSIKLGKKTKKAVFKLIAKIHRFEKELKKQ